MHLLFKPVACKRLLTAESSSLANVTVIFKICINPCPVWSLHVLLVSQHAGYLKCDSVLPVSVNGPLSESTRAWMKEMLK